MSITERKTGRRAKARPHKEVIELSQGGMAERSCRPAFSLPFHGLIDIWQVDFSDEVPDQFNLLPAVAAGLIRRMDDDLLYKLIDDGRR